MTEAGLPTDHEQRAVRARQRIRDQTGHAGGVPRFAISTLIALGSTSSYSAVAIATAVTSCIWRSAATGLPPAYPECHDRQAKSELAAASSAGLKPAAKGAGDTR